MTIQALTNDELLAALDTVLTHKQPYHQTLTQLRSLPAARLTPNQQLAAQVSMLLVMQQERFAHLI